MDLFINHYKDQDITPQIFRSFVEVIKALSLQKSLEDTQGNDINIANRITDPKFRFLTKDMPDISYDTSEAIAFAVKIGIELGKEAERKFNKEAQKKSILTRKINADDFAVEMKTLIVQLKSERKVSTYRDIVSILNNLGILTAQGGRWHLRTLQNVLKRAERLEKANR